MLIPIALLSAAVLMTPSGAADDARARKTAEELLRLLNVDVTMEQMAGRMHDLITEQFKADGSSPEGSEAASRGMKRVMELITDEMSFEKNKNEYIDIYVQTFTASELDGIVAFYRSPAGRRFLERMPELMKLSMDLGSRKAQALMPRIKEIAEQAAQEAVALDGMHVTMARMKLALVAMESYSVDHEIYPGPTKGFVNLSELRAELEPDYIKELPLQDQWETPLLVFCTNEDYWIVSAGSDGKFDRDYAAVIDPTAELGSLGVAAAAGADIIVANGEFVSGVPALKP